MEYKLIATDMDDTLLNEEHKISKENKEAIINIQKKGIKFVLASGRPTYGMYKFAKELEMDKFGGYIISFNGGQIMDMTNDEVVFQEGLSRDDIKRLYNISKELDIPMAVHINDTVWGSKDTENVRFESELCSMKFKVFNSLEELENMDIITKCMLIDEPEKVKAVEVYMKEHHNDDYFIAISKPIFLEIANKNVSKGKTITKLGEMLNIKNEEMIAVGDGGNDIPLLEVVGMPVAVENAVEPLKKIAKFISTSNENHGLKTVIEKFFNV